MNTNFNIDICFGKKIDVSNNLVYATWFNFWCRIYYHKKQRKLNENFSQKQWFYLSQNILNFLFSQAFVVATAHWNTSQSWLIHLQLLQVPLWNEHVKVKLSIVIGYFSCCYRGWYIFPSNIHPQFSELGRVRSPTDSCQT